MAPLAVEVARQHGWASSNYRDVIRQLKKTQLAGDAILPFYQARLKAIEEIVVAKNLVTLPDHSVTLSLAAADGTAQQPAPNTGQKGESVLPLNIPTAPEGSPDKFDDFTYDAVAWPMTAHVARPGQELLFNSMQHHGVSLARELYASNSTNIEAWGLYSEWIIQPYEPAEGQLITLQLRLLRAALVFLNSGLQSGKITPDDAAKVLQNDVVLSPAFAREEMENLIFSSPGQAYSGFYGYTQMLQLRKDTEAALGPKFDAKQFHDFLLAQGPLPPDLLRRAVMQDFIPAQKKKK
jgi:transposase-like protein